MPNASTVFVDTNILLYAASGRPVDAQKTERARELLTQEQVGLSFQVLQEFYANAINRRLCKLNLNIMRHLMARLMECGDWSPLSESEKAATSRRTPQVLSRSFAS